MNSLTLKVLNECAGRPVGNPFKVRAVWDEPLGTMLGFREIGTGLSVSLGQDMAFHITSLIRDVYILGHRIDPEDGELIVAIVNTHGNGIRRAKGDPIEFASVSIVEQSVKPVRFMETREGRRVIVGGPEEVEKDG